jgi:hypothetical protein
MKRKMLFEMSLVIFSIAASLIGMILALRGGWQVSEPNFYYALRWGVLGYASCRLLTIVPVATGVHAVQKFMVLLGIFSALLYIHIALNASA